MAVPVHDANVDATKTFLARCMDEELSTPVLLAEAKAFLYTVGADSKKDGRTMKAVDMVEQAAKLTWAMKHAAHLKDFQDLLADEQTAMAALFRGGKAKSEMLRIQRWARALVSPEPSPSKAVESAEEAVKAFAVEGADIALMSKSPNKGNADRKGRKSWKDDSRRDSDADVVDPVGGSPVSRWDTRRRASHSPPAALTSGKKVKRCIDGAGWDLLDETQHVFKHSKAEMLAEMPQRRVSILDLQRNLSFEQKAAYAKAVKLCTEVEPMLAHQVDFAKLMSDGASFEVLGKALAEGARWSSYDRDEGCTYETRIDNYTRSTNAALWRGAALALERENELPSALLIRLQTCVEEKYSTRSSDVAEELCGSSSVTKEIVDAVARQARQVTAIWRVLGTRIAKSAIAANEAAGKGSGADSLFTNKSWQRLLTPFFREHVLQVTQEDVADSMASGSAI